MARLRNYLRDPSHFDTINPKTSASRFETLEHSAYAKLSSTSISFRRDSARRHHGGRTAQPHSSAKPRTRQRTTRRRAVLCNNPSAASRAKGGCFRALQDVFNAAYERLSESRKADSGSRTYMQAQDNFVLASYQTVFISVITSALSRAS